MNNDSRYYDSSFTEYDLQAISVFPNPSKQGLERYCELLPIKKLSPFSLGEGGTPLTKADNLGSTLGFPELFIKHEEQNPTGSFKDRESLLAVALAKQKDLADVFIVSSGNAALSLAAYAKKARLACTCFIPEDTSRAKKELIQLFGANLVELPGNYEAIYREVANNYPREKNLTSGILSLRTDANKTIAYEIWEEHGVPDVIVVPCGNGGNLAGIGKGYLELFALGLVSKLPRLVGVQVAGASPLAQAFTQHLDWVVHPNGVQSMAEGILAEESYCSPKVMEILHTTNGAILEVTDLEIQQALVTTLETEALCIEPTSAAAFAAVPHLTELQVPSTAKVVIISTGSGLKNLPELVKLQARK